jgi:hypothetical protein
MAAFETHPQLNHALNEWTRTVRNIYTLRELQEHNAVRKKHVLYDLVSAAARGECPTANITNGCMTMLRQCKQESTDVQIDYTGITSAVDPEYSDGHERQLNVDRRLIKNDINIEGENTEAYMCYNVKFPEMREYPPLKAARFSTECVLFDRDVNMKMLNNYQSVRGRVMPMFEDDQLVRRVVNDVNHWLDTKYMPVRTPESEWFYRMRGIMNSPWTTAVVNEPSAEEEYGSYSITYENIQESKSVKVWFRRHRTYLHQKDYPDDILSEPQVDHCSALESNLTVLMTMSMREPIFEQPDDEQEQPAVQDEEAHTHEINTASIAVSLGLKQHAVCTTNCLSEDGNNQAVARLFHTYHLIDPRMTRIPASFLLYICYEAARLRWGNAIDDVIRDADPEEVMQKLDFRYVDMGHGAVYAVAIVEGHTIMMALKKFQVRNMIDNPDNDLSTDYGEDDPSDIEEEDDTPHSDQQHQPHHPQPGMHPYHFQPGMHPYHFQPGMHPLHPQPGMHPLHPHPGMHPHHFHPGMHPHHFHPGMHPHHFHPGMHPLHPHPGMIPHHFEPGMHPLHPHPGIHPHPLPPGDGHAPQQNIDDNQSGITEDQGEEKTQKANEKEDEELQERKAEEEELQERKAEEEELQKRKAEEEELQKRKAEEEEAYRKRNPQLISKPGSRSTRKSRKNTSTNGKYNTLSASKSCRMPNVHAKLQCIPQVSVRGQLGYGYGMIPTCAGLQDPVNGVKTNAPVKTNASVKTSAPVKTNASVKTNAPVKTSASVKTSAPVKTSASVRTSAPVKTSASVKTTAPVKTNASVKTNAPVTSHNLCPEGSNTAASEPLMIKVPTRTDFSDRLSALLLRRG